MFIRGVLVLGFIIGRGNPLLLELVNGMHIQVDYIIDPAPCASSNLL